MRDAQKICETMRLYKVGNTSEDKLLRSLVAWPNWFMPIDAASHAMLLTSNGRAWVMAFTDPISPDCEHSQFLEMRGRHLVRNIPEDATGLAFDLGRDHAVAVPREAFGQLIEMAAVLDLDDALDRPAPGQVRRFLEHFWLVLIRDGKPAVDGFRGLETVQLFTAQDELQRYFDRQPQHKELVVVKVAGNVLFAELSMRSDFDAIWIDAYREHMPDSEAHIREAYGPNMASALAQGFEFRPEAMILRARTIAELHLFLDQVGMVSEREHALEYADDGTGVTIFVARYRGKILGSDARDYLFHPVEQSDDPRDLGEGKSTILCAGKLADLVRRRLELLQTEPALFAADESDFAAVALQWVCELLKLVEGNCLPRHTLRSPDGARFVRERPEIATRAWLEGAHRQATSRVSKA